jgi:hypothetical protein
LCLLLAAGSVAVHPTVVFAQSTTALVRATVVDPQGRAVPQAIVTIRNVATGVTRDGIAGVDGVVTLAQLPPADYTLTATAPGFGVTPPSAITLNIGDALAVRLVVPLPNVAAEVSVTADLGRVQTSTSVGTVITQDVIANMPLSGRTIQSLYDLTPGVMRTAPGTGGQFSVNGQRPDANYVMVDGVSANVNASAFAASTGIAGTLPTLTVLNTTTSLVSVDALQEFRIETSTFAPEFGRTPGGQVSLVTRSGTNTFTGSAFEYFRHEKMDANDWFAIRNNLPKPPTRQHAFGGVFGGPVQLPGYSGRNRSFFFASYDGLRLKQPQTVTGVVPSLAARAQATGVMRDLLNVWPLPTGADLVNAQGQPTGAAEYATSFADPSRQNTLALRLDHALGSAGSLFLRGSNAPSHSDTRTQGMAYLRNTDRNTRVLTAGHTWIRGRVSNDLRVNYTAASASTTGDLDTYGGAVPVDPRVVFPAFTSPETASLTFQMNFGSLFPSFFMGTTSANTTRQINIVNNTVWNLGSHAVKVGIDYRRQAVDLVANTSISPNFPTLAQFYTGVVPSLSVTVRQRDVTPIIQNVSAYIQDTWRATDRLSLTYGLRWDLNPPPSTSDDRAIMALVNTDDLAALDAAPAGTPLFRTRYTDFAPRLGAAYQVRTQSGWETTLRTGAGLYHDLGMSIALLGYEGYPHRITVNYPNVTFPLADAAQVVMPEFRTTPPYTTSYGYAEDFVTPRTWQWNVTVEQALGTTRSLSVAYVGAAGRRLARVEAHTRPNVRFGDQVRITRNNAASDYKALQVQFTQRLWAGLNALASYTWSHSTDTGSSSGIANNVIETVAPIDRNRADSDYDVRHNFAASVTWELAGLPTSGLLRTLTNGLAVDVLVKARTGSPVDITGRSLSAPLSGTLRANLVPGQPLYLDDKDAPGGRRFNPAAFTLAPVGVQGDLPRNFMRGFGARQVDLAVRRDIAIRAARVQLRAEVFNVFNFANFGNPVGSVSSSSFGRSTAMLNRSLNGLSSLYEMGGPRSGQLAVKVLF